jgi:hypothetical protein
MNLELLTEFERAVRSRNPLLASKFQPGLPPAAVRRALTGGKVTGEIDSLLTLYGWRNGHTLDFELRRSQKGLFPGKPFYFPSLEMSIGHFGHFAEAARTHLQISEAAGRYFPVFWDGSNGWFGVDVQNSHHRVMMMDLKSPQPFAEAYSSMDELIADGIRANKEDRPLTACISGRHNSG